MKAAHAAHAVHAARATDAPGLGRTWNGQPNTHATVRMLVCGNSDRGDDGVAVSAAARTLRRLPVDLLARLEVRRSEALCVEDLLDIPADMACLILDAVAGPEPGSIVRLPLSDLRRPGAPAPHSSHQLPIAQVIALGEVLRGTPLRGSLVGVAGRSFGYGQGKSAAVRAAMPALCHAIAAEVAELVGEGR